MSEARQMVARIARRRHNAGCGDGACVFGHPGGMHTNGGCRCTQERNPVLLRQIIFQLSDIAQILAAMVEEEKA